MFSAKYDIEEKLHVQTFDLLKQEFSRISTVKESPLFETSFFGGENYILVMASANREVKRCSVWHAASKKTYPCPTPDIASGQFSYFAWLGDRLFIVREVFGESLPHLHEYNLTTNTWSSKEIPFTTRQRRSCFIYGNGDLIYLYGGRAGFFSFNPFKWISPHESIYNDHFVNDGLIYNTKSRKFSPMPSNDLGSTRVTFHIQQLVGFSKSGILHMSTKDKEAYLYDFTSKTWSDSFDPKLPFDLSKVACRILEFRLVCVGKKTFGT